MKKNSHKSKNVHDGIPGTSEFSSLTSDKLDKYSVNYYKNIGLEELESLCERTIEYHLTKTYIPPPSKALFPCKNKKKETTSWRHYNPDGGIKGRTSFGQGRVGTTCESYGIKSCVCCNNQAPRASSLDNVLDSLLKARATPQSTVSNSKNSTIPGTPPTGIPRADGSVYDLDVEHNYCDRIPTLTYNLAGDTEPQSYTTLDKFESATISGNTEQAEDIWKYINSVTTDFDEEEQLRLQKLNEENLLSLIKNESFNLCTETENMEVSASEIVSGRPNEEYPLLSNDLDDSVQIVEVHPPASAPVRTRTINLDAPVEIIDLVSGNDDEILLVPNKQIPTVSDIIDLDDSIYNQTPPKEDTTKTRGWGECPVCLESLQNTEIMSTICGHIFCARCIKNSIKMTKKCPNCRKQLTLKSIHPLFI